jgi:hypothetical protein
MSTEIVEVGATKLDRRNNTITIQTKRLAGVDDQDAQDLGELPVWYPCGFAGAPRTGMQGALDTDLGAIVGFRDSAIGDFFGILKAGESLQYGPAQNFVRCKADGSVTAFTTDDGTKDGQSVYHKVAPTEFVRFAPWGTERFDAGGWHMRHHTGARIEAGGIGGLPSPLDQLGSYVTLSAALAKIEATAITLGPAAGVPEPAAKALALNTTLAAMQSAITALASAVAALRVDVSTATGAGVTSATPAGSAVTAAATSASAVTAAIGTIPSQSVSVT